MDPKRFRRSAARRNTAPGLLAAAAAVAAAALIAAPTSRDPALSGAAPSGGAVGPPGLPLVSRTPGGSGWVAPEIHPAPVAPPAPLARRYSLLERAREPRPHESAPTHSAVSGAPLPPAPAAAPPAGVERDPRDPFGSPDLPHPAEFWGSARLAPGLSPPPRSVSRPAAAPEGADEDETGSAAPGARPDAPPGAGGAPPPRDREIAAQPPARRPAPPAAGADDPLPALLDGWTLPASTRAASTRPLERLAGLEPLERAADASDREIRLDAGSPAAAEPRALLDTALAAQSGERTPAGPAAPQAAAAVPASDRAGGKPEAAAAVPAAGTRSDLPAVAAALAPPGLDLGHARFAEVPTDAPLLVPALAVPEPATALLLALGLAGLGAAGRARR